MLQQWAGKFQVREKGPADLVTEADLASQEIVKQTLLGAFPQHGFLAEENASIPSRDQGYRWIVDPLDGTTNYVHGIPAYCVSIALEQAGQLQVGTIYDPVADHCYSAVSGGGAWLNGKRLSTSRVSRLADAVVASSLPPQVTRESHALAEFIEVVTHVQSVRRMGSSALNLCYVAAGQYDAYWSEYAHVWDVAAGVLIVREAGGQLSNCVGGEFRLDPPHFAVAGTESLHRELLTLLSRVGR